MIKVDKVLRANHSCGPLEMFSAVFRRKKLHPTPFKILAKPLVNCLFAIFRGVFFAAMLQKRKTCLLLNNDKNKALKQPWNYFSNPKTHFVKFQTIRNSTVIHTLLPSRSKKSCSRSICANMSSLLEARNAGHRTVRLGSSDRWVSQIFSI